MTKILIVDDSELVRSQLKEMLEQVDCDVCEAEDGLEALKVYEQEEPSLVICDVNMPNMNGIEFLKKIISQDPDAMVVMLSAIEDEAVMIECMLHGAKEYLIKPFDAEKTYNVVHKLLGEFI